MISRLRSEIGAIILDGAWMPLIMPHNERRIEKKEKNALINAFQLDSNPHCKRPEYPCNRSNRNHSPQRQQSTAKAQLCTFASAITRIRQCNCSRDRI
jgi:hypothetical protein